MCGPALVRMMLLLIELIYNCGIVRIEGFSTPVFSKTSLESSLHMNITIITIPFWSFCATLGKAAPSFGICS